jgi:hypothetical protein
MTVTELARLPSRERKRFEADCEALKSPTGTLEYLRAHPEELEAINALPALLRERALVYLARLCCHASTKELRTEHPIDGDLKPTPQEKADTKLFGDGEGKPAEYVRIGNLTESN